TTVWVISAGLLICLWFLVVFALDGGNAFVAGAAVASAALLVVYLSYFFPMLAVFEAKRWGGMLKNAFLMAAAHPVSSMLVLGGLAVPIVLFGLWYGTILFSIALYAAIESFHLGRLFAPFVRTFVPDDPVD
ncbi:MAG TPA: hypothetical protein DCR44_03015, partial [Acholeplasmatales bacterium]|nr:hypothetical protein [Acholeplasmatales bacterium]